MTKDIWNIGPFTLCWGWLWREGHFVNRHIRLGITVNLDSGSFTLDFILGWLHVGHEARS